MLYLIEKKEEVSSSRFEKISKLSQVLCETSSYDEMKYVHLAE
jgi:hypothetical protein